MKHFWEYDRSLPVCSDRMLSGQCVCEERPCPVRRRCEAVAEKMRLEQNEAAAQTTTQEGTTDE